MAVNYSILADVKLDASTVQPQLDKLGGKIKVDAVGATAGMKGLNDQTAKTLLTYQMAHKIFSMSVDTMKSMTQQVYKMDAAQIEFQKVSDLSGSALDKYTDKLTNMGGKVARTGSEMLEAATEFRKNGFNDQDSAQLARVATMFQNVSDEAISASNSASFIISQMIAFGDNSPEYAEHIIDSVNSVANSFSVSSGQMAQGLGIVASTSAAMGNSMEETLGMMTAITEQTRSVSKSARGLNSIMASLADVLNEDSSNGQKITEVYDKWGLSMKDANGHLKSGYNLLKDLAGVWDQIGREDPDEQQRIASLIAGKNQLNNFMALMNNFEHATEAVEVALNSQGSAVEENERYMGGLNIMGPLKRI